MRIDRLLAIVMILINREKITARELAERLEVSTRTILRDMEAIGLAGIPVISYPGRNGGFGLVDGFRLDRSVLSASDVLTILTALKGVSTALDDQQTLLTLEKFKSIAAAAGSPLPDPGGSNVEINVFPWGATRYQSDKLATIRKALNERKVISFEYTSTREESTHRVVEPVTLVLKGQHWYIHAYCRLREDYRVFRLTRMREVQILTETFDKHELSPDALDWADFKDVDGPTARIQLRFDPTVHSRVCDVFDAERIARTSDGYLEVSVNWPLDEWLQGLILSFGEAVEVVSPLSLRSSIRKKAHGILSRYAREDD